MSSSMTTGSLFGVPIYERAFDKHAEFKPKIMEFLKDESLFEKNTNKWHLAFTHPNLHKEKILKPFVSFVEESLAVAFEDLGFEPSFELTGLWATKQTKDGGFHHRHSHFNSFWAGVYYLNGTSDTAGTTFYSPYNYHNIIFPARIKNKKVRMKNTHTIPFAESKLVLFPAWLQHDTEANHSTVDRYILSFNCMPVGKTTQDPFDRYNYQSIKDAELVSYNEELIE